MRVIRSSVYVARRPVVASGPSSRLPHRRLPLRAFVLGGLALMRFFILIFLSFMHLQAIAGSVLILDDEYGDEVSQHLQSTGHTVTSVTYFDWDGTNPAPNDYDLVLLLNGINYGDEFDKDKDSPAYDILSDYVEAGGTFMFTEWTAYAMANTDNDGYQKLRLGPLVPFNVETYVDWDYGGTFTTSVASALTRGVPESFAVANDPSDGGGCIASFNGGARVLMTRDFDYFTTQETECDQGGGHPGLVVRGVGQGTVIWFNSDLGHEDGYDAGPNQLKIIANSVGYDVRADTTLNPPPATPVPTLPLFGLGILVSLLGLFGLHRLRP